MATTLPLAQVHDGWKSTTVRRFTLAVGFAFAALVFGTVIYALEKYAFRVEHRFVENPGSVMMRACGLTHFLIGWLFLFTSPRLRSWPSLGRLLTLTGIGVLLCALTYHLGGERNPFIFLFVYGYFLTHEIRDQTFLYQTHREAPREPAAVAFRTWLQWTMTLCLISLLVSGYLFYGVVIKKHAWLVQFPDTFYWAIVSGLGVMCVLAADQTLQTGREGYGSVGIPFQTHFPLVVVYAGIFLVMFFGSLLGAVSFNLIILIHAGAWLVFVYHKLGEPQPPRAKTVWTWLRYTPTGFLVLHLALIAILLVLMAVRVYVWQRVGLVSRILEGNNFPYWSLMHISMSFWRGR